MVSQVFGLNRVKDEQLWVKTPFPVPQNVWADFVFQIFPEFQIPIKHSSLHRYQGRHINRRRDYDEIADGQVNAYIHAYLPHCQRREGMVHDFGVVHVPDIRAFYLEQIQADLEENPRARSALLESLRQVHVETVSYLLNELMNVSKVAHYQDVKTTKELRDVFGKKLAKIGLIRGCYTPYGQISHEIPIGELPLYMNGENINFLQSQTCLDFLRDLDSVFGIDRELQPMEILGVQLAMNQRYRHIVKV